MRAAREVQGPGLVAGCPDAASPRLSGGGSAPMLGGPSGATHRNESIGACAPLPRNWSNADPVDPAEVSYNSWSWVLWNGLWQCFPSSTITQTGGKKKKETTHSGSSKWLRTSDAPAPRKGKSCVRIHSGRAAMICRLHTYLHKRKK